MISQAGGDAVWVKGPTPPGGAAAEEGPDTTGPDSTARHSMSSTTQGAMHIGEQLLGQHI